MFALCALTDALTLTEFDANVLWVPSHVNTHVVMSPNVDHVPRCPSVDGITPQQIHLARYADGTYGAQEVSLFPQFFDLSYPTVACIPREIPGADGELLRAPIQAWMCTNRSPGLSLGPTPPRLFLLRHKHIVCTSIHIV